MKIYIGADHNGFHMRSHIISYLTKAGYDVEDQGDKELDLNDDYPIIAARVVVAMRQSADKDPRGILLCGSGQGVCIAANRFRGIRACLGYNPDTVRHARNDDDCNVLCLPAKSIQNDQAMLIIETWLNVPFAGAPRFVRRNQQLDEIGG